ncbi:PREDICTED: protein HGH1 homolog [Papilio polytes]|uniref:protein HGH1 homolog n=1 Tax=Papilio polytes TaxID=76194 RepID=UPI000676A780|nr:PREDICTED: protein HGH1 homolog [Papilio polytes]
MEKDTLNELQQFLKPEARIDLKLISLDHLIGVSGTEDGVKVLLGNENILKNIIDCTNDKIDNVIKKALLLLINITAHSEGSIELLKLKPNNASVLDIFVGYILDSQKTHADAVCMVLSNITRVEENVEQCVDILFKHLNDLLNVFVNTEFNKKGCDLEYLAPMFSNLSRSGRVRDWLVKENPHIPLIKLLPFCQYEKSIIRRGGAIGTLRNLTFDVQYHKFLLSPDLDLLTYLLGPLMGGEDYCDEEMDKLPIALQYLPKEKQRELDIDIRKMILETLNKLCSKHEFREILRGNGVYYVLRELHKWEKEPTVCLACENVVDILIQKEEEVGAEDLSKIDVPEDMIDKFEKMDAEYLNN